MKSFINKLIKFAKEKKKDKKKKKKEEEAQKPTPIAPEVPQKPLPVETPQESPQQAEEALKALLGGMPEEAESRTMLLNGELDEEKAAEILSGLIALSQLKPPKKDVKEGELPYDPITLYISTYGGSADEMFALFDMMEITKTKCNIETT
jgi:ATP-dependent protease ClpP protease subunit